MSGAEPGDWQCGASIRHAVCMSITYKVVPIQESKSRIIARDPKAQRVILGIGSERIAIDFTSRITRLPPHTGDEPAPVLGIEPNKKKAKARVNTPRD